MCGPPSTVPIPHAPPVRGEAALGRGAHYAIGVAFAGLLVALAGPEYLSRPTLIPALIVGVATVVAPLFMLQPTLGMGRAASRTPHPWVVRGRSLIAHTSYGLGLYLAAVAWHGLTR